MTINTASGAKLYIGSTQPAADIAEFETDSYIEVGEVEDLGEQGDESERVKFTSLSDARTRSLKGPRDAGEQTVVVGDDMTDEGQVAMEAAEAQPHDYNFIVELNDAVTIGGTNSRHYFRAKVFSKKRNIGNASNVVRRNFVLGINTAILSSDPT